MTEKTKRCGNGHECIHPDGPQLPMSEYYKSAKWLCKPCMRDYRNRDHKKNRERDNKRSLEYIGKNKERVYQKRDEYLAANKEALNAKQREKYWTDPDTRARQIAWHHNKRAEQYGVSGTLSANDYMTKLKAQCGKCWYCGIELENNWHTDHRVPMSRGGHNTPENVVLCCAPCNQKKNHKLPHEWNGRLL